MEITAFRLTVLCGLIMVPFMLARPRWFLYLYLALLACFPNYIGVKQGIEVLNLYGAGSGVLPVPLINLYLYGLSLLSILFFRKLQKTTLSFHPMLLFGGLSLLYLSYAMLGYALGMPSEEIIDSRSGINLLNMTLLMLVLSRIIRDSVELEKLMVFLVAVILARDSFGLVRYLYFGGDIANIYANIERINIKLTFQDINDNLLACIVGFYAAWRLAFDKASMSLPKRLLFWGIVALTCFIILFSFRRTSWVGLLLAGGYFVLKQPWRRRIQVGAVIAGIGAFIFSTLVAMRLGQYQGRRASMFLYDVTSSRGDVTTKEGRFTELAAAFETIKEHWFLGVGPWGNIAGFGDRDYIHGGFLQVWLKLGIVGLLLVLLGMAAYTLFVWAKGPSIPPEKRGWFEAGFAGFLFMIPNSVIGTPVIEFRTMQWMGFCIMLPFLAYRAYASDTLKIGGIGVENPHPPRFSNLLGNTVHPPHSKEVVARWLR